MTNENKTNAPRVPLNDDQKAKLAAALAASKGADQPKPVDVKPVTVDHKSNPTLPAPATGKQQPAIGAGTSGGPLQGGAEKPISELVKAATTALSNTDDKATADVAVAALATATNLPVNPAKATADVAVAALATATNLPVNPAKVASTEPATANADHKAAIDKANANVGKGQGGTVAKGKGKGNTKPAPAPVTVAAAKPKPLGKAAAAMANTDNVQGYDLRKWPAWLDCCPTEADILAFRAFNLKRAFTKNELAGATYLNPKSSNYNVYDVAEGLRAIMGGQPDHKMNTVGKGEGSTKFGFTTLDQSKRLPSQNPHGGGGTARVCYHVTLTDRGRKLALAYLELHKVKVPKYMLPENGQGKPADKGKATPASGTPASA